MPVSLASTTAAATKGALVPIAFTTVSNSTTDVITFNNIPQIYQDLSFVIFTGATASYIFGAFRLNNDSGSTYGVTALSGDGASAISARLTNSTYGVFGGNVAGIVAASGNYSSSTMNILNYTNSSTFKTTLARFAQDRNGAGETSLTVSTWRSTAAVTRIDFISGNTPSGYFLSGSTFALYGVRRVGQ